MYESPTFNTTVQVPVVVTSGVTLGTGVASATSTFTGTLGKTVNGAYKFPNFDVPIKVVSIRITTITAAATGDTLVMSFLNGTQTIGTATPAAAGSSVDSTIAADVVDAHGVVITSSSPALFTGTSNEITMKTVAVTTASADALGTYAVDLRYRNLFTQ